MSYIPGTPTASGVATGVLAFNGRYGTVALSYQDIINALGYAPATASSVSSAAVNAATATALQTPRTINGVSFDGTANITIPSSAYSVVTKTAGYTETATSGQLIIQADLAAGFTIVLPTAVGNTASITVKKMQSAGQITIDGAGAETIDGGLTAVLNNLSEAISLVSNNVGWDII